MAGLDVDFDAHSGAQWWQTPVARVDAYSHRNSLHNFHPIAAGILSGQKRELLRGRWTNALHGADPLRVGIRVHCHQCCLAGADISQLSLLRVGDNPDVIRGDERKSGH
jgi:hypothetical protein